MGSTTAQGTQISAATSVKLVRNLMRTAVAEVVYARGLLPPDNFELIEMCDVQLHAVRDAPDVVGAPIFRNLEEGVFDALARGVLEKCVLIVSRDQAATDIVEAWTFAVEWSARGPALRLSTISGTGATIDDSGRTFVTPNDVRRSTKQLLRTLCMMLQSLEDVVHNPWIGFQVYYVNNKPPENYDPPGFHRVHHPGNVVHFRSKPHVMTVPTVATGSNTFAVSVATACTEEAHAEAADEAFAWDLDQEAPAKVKAAGSKRPVPHTEAASRVPKSRLRAASSSPPATRSGIRAG